MVGMVAGIGNFASIVVQNLLLVPIFLSYWGQETYGIWLSLLAAQTMLQTVNTSHQGYVGNELNRSIHAKCVSEFALTMGSNVFIAICLGMLQLFIVAGLVITGSLGSLLGTKTGADTTYAWGFGILVSSWVVTGPVIGILVKLYAPFGHFARGSWLGVGQRILQTLAVAICVKEGAKLLAVAIAYSATSIITNSVIFCDARRMIRRAGFWTCRLNIGVGVKDLGRSLVIVVRDLMEQGGNSGLILMIGHTLGVAIIPTFTTLRTLANTAMQAATILLQPIATDFIRLHSARRGRDIAEILAVAWFAAGAVINIAMAAMLPFVPMVYDAWVRHRIGFDETTFILLMWTVVIKNFGAPITMYLSTNNHLNFMSAAAFFRNAITVILAAIVMIPAGIRGVAMVLVLAEIVASVWIPLRFAASELASVSGKLNRAAIWLAVAEQSVWLGIATTALLFPLCLRLVVEVSVLALSLIAWIRWKNLGAESTKRLLSVLKLS